MLKWNRIEILQCRDFIFFIGHVGEGTLITFIILDIVYSSTYSQTSELISVSRLGSVGIFLAAAYLSVFSRQQNRS